MTWQNLNLVVQYYTLQTSYLFLLGNIVVFAVLAFYLDQVFPNEFGTKKHPLFFLKFLFGKNKSTVQQKNDSVIKKEIEEEVDDFLKQMQVNN